MSTVFRCARKECGEKLELPLAFLPARNEAFRLGWKFRGSLNGLEFFCPLHAPPPSRRPRRHST